MICNDFDSWEERFNMWCFAIDEADDAISEKQAKRESFWHFAHNEVADIYCWEKQWKFVVATSSRSSSLILSYFRDFI